MADRANQEKGQRGNQTAGTGAGVGAPGTTGAFQTSDPLGAPGSTGAGLTSQDPTAIPTRARRDEYEEPGMESGGGGQQQQHRRGYGIGKEHELRDPTSGEYGVGKTQQFRDPVAGDYAGGQTQQFRDPFSGEGQTQQFRDPISGDYGGGLHQQFRDPISGQYGGGQQQKFRDPITGEYGGGQQQHIRDPFSGGYGGGQQQQFRDPTSGVNDAGNEFERDRAGHGPVGLTGFTTVTASTGPGEDVVYGRKTVTTADDLGSAAGGGRDDKGMLEKARELKDRVQGGGHHH